jgi:hypothetical protein
MLCTFLEVFIIYTSLHQNLTSCVTVLFKEDIIIIWSTRNMFFLLVTWSWTTITHLIFWLPILRAKQTFLFVYICIVIVDPIIKKAEGGDPILLYTARCMFVPVPSQELDFHRHMLWSFFSIIYRAILFYCIRGSLISRHLLYIKTDSMVYIRLGYTF